ncbi:MAG: flagellar hook-basal body complex protein FliE [Alphaproteobacteria bacterium]|nr:flagellar hook-basal body complex protein FliE [Alphaproteobacteria bacterium]
MDRIIDPSIAARAYGNTSNISGRSGETDSGEGSGGVSFSDFLKDKVRDSIDTLHASEEMSARAVTGEADITDVVQAVSSAELTLQTVVAVRDRLIGAYQEIMRMPI